MRPVEAGHINGQETHVDVEPVEQVLGLWVEEPRKIAYVFSTVGEERDLLVSAIPCDFSTSNSRRLGSVS